VSGPLLQVYPLRFSGTRLKKRPLLHSLCLLINVYMVCTFYRNIGNKRMIYKRKRDQKLLSVTGRQHQPLHQLRKEKRCEGTRKMMCEKRRRGSIPLEKPKDERKKREGEPCSQAFADEQVLLQATKILQSKLQYLYGPEPTGVRLPTTPPMGQAAT